MPEGDTIFRAARALNKALGGRVVTSFETAVAKLASLNDDAPVAGRTVERVEARGKWCLVFFSGDLILLTHMRMSGSWHLYRVGERWQLPRRAMRVVITCGEVQAIGFNIPVAEFHTSRSLERNTDVPQLGLDVLGGNYNVTRATQALKEYGLNIPDAEVATVLLNQRVLAGIGNVYKSESCFAARVNPFRAISNVSERELESIAEIAERYMQANVAEAQGRGDCHLHRAAPYDSRDGARCAALGVWPRRTGVPSLRRHDRAKKAGDWSARRPTGVLPVSRGLPQKINGGEAAPNPAVERVAAVVAVCPCPCSSQTFSQTGCDAW